MKRRDLLGAGAVVALGGASIRNAAAAPVKVVVPGIVPELQQPSPNTCWATSATMLRSWKAKQSLTIQQVMKEAGPAYATAFANDKGLKGSDKSGLLKALGMQAEPPQNYTVAGWAKLMTDHGPLWVTTNEGTAQSFAVHARVLVELDGDGSYDKTYVTLIDPAVGTRQKEPLKEFIRKFEEVASRPG